MNRIISSTLAAFLLGAASVGNAAPVITGTPTLDGPQQILWPRLVQGTPDLSEPTANLLTDVVADISKCDLVLSTAGNYHMALRQMWDVYVSRHGSGLENVVYTTSPPVAAEQIKQKNLIVGNTSIKCRPQVVVAPKRMMDRLQTDGALDGEPVPLYASRGNVILVKKGNPKRIKGIWDLGRHDVRIVTPNPTRELGSFETYYQTIYDVANADTSHRGKSADKLFNSIFNSGRTDKWYTGSSIHHREVPWSIAYGKADAGVIFYHLGKYIIENVRDAQGRELFDIVPLAGNVHEPEKVFGNKVAQHYIAKIKGEWSEKQRVAADNLVFSMLSADFATILINVGITPMSPTYAGAPTAPASALGAAATGELTASNQ